MLISPNTEVQKSFWTPKLVARIAILLALSAVGAMIKIPTSIGTPSLDSAAGYFGAAAFGPLVGSIVAGFGHLFTAYVAGFPFGPVIHTIIAIEQVLWAVLFWFLVTRVNIWVGGIVAVLCNGIIAAASMIPFLGMPTFIPIMIQLIIASAINVLIAASAYKIVKKSNLI